MLLNSRGYDNDLPDGHGVMEVVTKEGQARQFVPLRSTVLRGQVDGPLAALQAVQTYRFSKEEHAGPIEALYRFPLPGDAAVTGAEVVFGAAKVTAELKERGEAEKEYEEAKKKGQQAALVTRESPHVFTMHVAGIRPDEDAVVTVTFTQLAQPEGAGWLLRHPLTTPPRYTRSDEVHTRHGKGQPLEVLRDPGHRFSLDLLLYGVAEATSPTHGITATPEEAGLRVRLSEGEVIPNKDLVLTWKPRQQKNRPSLEVLLQEAEDGFTYFMALLTPPAESASGDGAPREVIYLLDRSGSMGGPKMTAARWSVVQAVRGLTPKDHFALSAFDDKQEWFGKHTLHAAKQSTVDDAVRFLEERDARGGTELGVVLEQALQLPRQNGNVARHLLIITDAQVTDEARIMGLIKAEGQQSQRRRVSVLAIDSAPNSFLIQRMARWGNGVARFLSSDPSKVDITTALVSVLETWAEPVLANARLLVNCRGVEAAEQEVSAGPQSGMAVDMGDLTANRTCWAVGRFSTKEGLPEFSISSGGQQVATFKPERAQSAVAAPGARSLFGAWRVLGLELLVHSGMSGSDMEEELKRLGYDPAAATGQVKSVYHENRYQEAGAALKDLLVKESLSYGIVCSETGFVAVRRDSSGEAQVGESFLVGSALPEGWDEGFINQAAPLGGVRAVYPGAVPPPTPLPAGTPTMLASTGRAPKKAGLFRARAEVNQREAGEAQDKKVPVPSFDGVPTFTGGEAILLDSRQQEIAAGVIKGLRVILPKQAAVDPRLEILIFVGDLAMPRARVTLADMLKQGGYRPLNIRRDKADVVLVVLRDPSGSWTQAAPQVRVTLEIG